MFYYKKAKTKSNYLQPKLLIGAKLASEKERFCAHQWENYLDFGEEV